MVWELNILPTGVDKAYAMDNGPQWRWKDRASWGEMQGSKEENKLVPGKENGRQR